MSASTITERALTAWQRERERLEAEGHAAGERLRQAVMRRVRELLEQPAERGALELEAWRNAQQPGEWYVRVAGGELLLYVVPGVDDGDGEAPYVMLAAVGELRLPAPEPFTSLAELGRLLERYGAPADPPPRPAGLAGPQSESGR